MKKIILLNIIISLLLLIPAMNCIADPPYWTNLEEIAIFESFEQAIASCYQCADSQNRPDCSGPYTGPLCPKLTGLGLIGPAGCVTDACSNLCHPCKVYCFYSIKEPEDLPANDCSCNKEEKKSGQQCPYNYSGDSIDILTGAYRDQETDLQFNTTFEKGFELYRTYHSRVNTDSPFGFSWTHNYNVTLETFGPPEARAYQIRDEANQVHYFQDRLNVGLYIGILTTKGSFQKETDGTFTWYRSNGVEYRFNALLKLISKKDGKNQLQILIYDADNRLVSVTDQATGRSLGFVYNSAGRVEQIIGPVTPAVPDGIWVRYQYDTNGNLTRVTYADGSGFEYRYQDTIDIHNITEKRDLAGAFIASWQYYAFDMVYKNITRDGKGVTISYAGDRSWVWVTDAWGVKKIYTITKINGIRRITSVTQTGGCTSCGGDGVRYVYDTQRRVIEKELANGRINKYQDFDSQSRYQTEIQASGTSSQRTFHYVYHPVLGTHLSVSEDSVLNPGSKQTIYDYDNDANAVPNENPTNLIYRQIEKGFTKDQSGTVVPYEYITSFTYNANGQVLTVDGPKPGDQDKVTYTYYANGDLQSITQPLIGSTIYDQYDAAGHVGRGTDPNGLVTTMTYDARGRIKTRTTETNNAVVTYNYNTAGDIASVTDAMGITFTYAYDPAYNRLEKVIDPQGNYLKYSYDTKGNRIEQGYYTPSNSRTYQVRYNYQHPTYKGRLYKVINPDNTFTEYNYDNTGNITSIKDPRGKITTYQYDLFNRIKSVIQPGNIITNYAYDNQDHLIMVTDAKNNMTLYTYDDPGRVLSVTSPDTGTATYVYDEASNLVSMIDAKNQETRFTYDILNRVLTKQHFLNGLPSSVVGPTSYSYDQGSNAKGKLTLVMDPSGSQAYEYNEIGRLELETKIVNGISFQILYGYNKNNELETMTYPSGRVVTYNKNSAGWIDSMSTTYESNTVALIQNMTRLPFGPINGLSLGNGLNQVMAYDQLYRMTGSQTGSIYNRSYTYNANNNITNIQDLVTPAKNQVFGYDDLNRLTNATGSYGAIAYTYDAVGNRLSLTKGTQVENYTYQTDTNRLNSISGTDPISYTYDSNGNITGLGPKTLAYTPDNRLLEVQPITPIQDNLKSEYVYNSQGQRVQKKVYKFVADYWQLETGDLFIYDIQGNLILEADQSGEILKEYLYLEGNRIAQYGYDDLQMSQAPRPRLAQRGLKPQLQLSVFSGPKPIKKPEIKLAAVSLVAGMLLQVNPGDIYNEVLYYYVNDHLGTPQLMADHEGQVVWRADYDPFGAAAVDLGSSTVNQHRFPGQYADEETQLHYNYHRYYDPRSGRYITADPIGMEGGSNLFAYVGNDPVNAADFMGLYNSSDVKKAWDNYCSGTQTPWSTSFGSISWDNAGSRLIEKAAKKFGGGSCTKQTITVSETGGASAQGADAYIIGRHQVKLDGQLKMNCDCSYTFTGTLSSALGYDPYDFNPSNRGTSGEVLTWIGRNRCPKSGKTFNIYLTGGTAVQAIGVIQGTPSSCCPGGV